MAPIKTSDARGAGHGQTRQAVRGRRGEQSPAAYSSASRVREPMPWVPARALNSSGGSVARQSTPTITPFSLAA
ncbi:MAG: hypothetical protein AB1449_11285 [Chloroflexota bacterium]